MALPAGLSPTTFRGALSVLDLDRRSRSVLDRLFGTAIFAGAGAATIVGGPVAGITAAAWLSLVDPKNEAVSLLDAAVTKLSKRLRGTQGKDQLELVVAPGLDHLRLKARAPYDLLIANILAGPLIERAPSLAGALAPGGRLILAGLLDHQAEAVTAAYRRQGMMAGTRVQRGDWPTLVLRKRKATGWR